MGSAHSVEQKIIEAAHIPFYAIPAGKMRRYFSLQNVVDMFKVVGGLGKAFITLRNIKPDLVFAKGGYVSVPVVYASRLLKIPVWIHESDLSPGLSTKLASKVAQRVYVSFDETVKLIRHKDVRVVGNPIRKEMQKGDAKKGESLIAPAFTHRKPLVLIMGGSTGARSLNEIVVRSLAELTTFANVVHLTGPHHDPVATAPYHHSYRAFPFLNEQLADIYAACDVIVTRAGSGSIFESLALHKPLILIPLPRSASRGDQIENAEACAKHGWATVLDQDHLSTHDFVSAIRTARTTKQSSEKQPHLDAALRIAKDMTYLLATN